MSEDSKSDLETRQTIETAPKDAKTSSTTVKRGSRATPNRHGTRAPEELVSDPGAIDIDIDEFATHTRRQTERLSPTRGAPATDTDLGSASSQGTAPTGTEATEDPEALSAEAEQMTTPLSGLSRSQTLDQIVSAIQEESELDAGLEGDTDPHIVSPADPGIVALRAPLVGRQDALNRLKEVFLDSWNNRCVNLVTLMGDAGYGKTRLAREFARSVNAAIPDARVLWGSAIDPHGAPYEAIAGALAARFGVGHAEQPEDIRLKIANAVAESLPEPLHEEVTHLIAHLMGAPFPESPVIDSLSRELRDLDLRCHIAVRRFLEQQAAKGPLLLCFDGMENAREETINLLHYLAENMPSHPVLILSAARPSIRDTHPKWGEGAIKHHQVDVAPLSPDDMLELFRALLNVKAVPDEVARRVRQTLGGSPRAVFGFARFLLEVRAIRGDEGNWQFWRPRLAQLDLPNSPTETIRARLRALPGAERDLLKHAATIGSVFWVDTLVALVRANNVAPEQPDGPSLEHIAAWGTQTNEEVLALLGNLCQRGLLLESPSTTIAGEREYRFVYEPLCELTYELCALPEPGDSTSAAGSALQTSVDARRSNHQTVAQWFRLRPGVNSELRQQQIAQQLELAADHLNASLHYQRAATSAWCRHDATKAVELYQRALSSTGVADLGRRLDLWHALGEISALRGEFDAALHAYERTLRLSWVIASRPRAALAFSRMGRIWRTRGNLKLALEYLTRGLEMSSDARDHSTEASCLDDIAQLYAILGRNEIALDYVAKALELRRKIGRRDEVAQSLSTIGRIERDRGYFSAADSCFREALGLWRESRDRHGYLVSLIDIGTLHLQRSQLEQARDSWERTLREAKRLEARPLITQLHILLGELAIRRNDLNDAREQVQSAVNMAADTHDRLQYLQALRVLGVVELLDGNADEGRLHIEECIALASDAELLPASATELVPCVARAHQSLAEVHAATLFDASAQTGPPPAEQHFLRAIELFSQMGARADQARALKRLGEYRVERGEWESGGISLREALVLAEELELPETKSISESLHAKD
jgi:tetratricopeptide (TPR) repeat protein